MAHYKNLNLDKKTQYKTLESEGEGGVKPGFMGRVAPTSPSSDLRPRLGAIALQRAAPSPSGRRAQQKIGAGTWRLGDPVFSPSISRLFYKALQFFTSTRMPQLP